MKTPRELLLERHRGAERKLAAVRRAALATVETPAPADAPMSWREWLRSLRWHQTALAKAAPTSMMRASSRSLPFMG